VSREEVCRAIEEAVIDPDELAEVLQHAKIGDENVRDELMKLVDGYVIET
jgi:hypothetical protein